jgi:hypothetical protein
MDKIVGEKGEKTVHYGYYVPKSPYNSLRSLHAVIAYLYPNCTLRVQQYVARKGDPKPCPKGDLMQMMSMKNIAFTFLFRSPDSETCLGYFTHPLNFLGITYGLMKYFCAFRMDGIFAPFRF